MECRIIEILTFKGIIMKKMVLLKEEELKTIYGGSEASEGFIAFIGYCLKKYARYAPSTSTLVNCSAT